MNGESPQLEKPFCPLVSLALSGLLTVFFWDSGVEAIWIEVFGRYLSGATFYFQTENLELAASGFWCF